MSRRVLSADAAGAAWRLLLLAGACYATGLLGVALRSSGSWTALVWLPTGIAVAGLYRWGWRYWPAVAAAAVLLSLSAGTPAGAAVGFAIGRTLGPLVAVAVLRRAGFQPAFERQRDVLLFCATAAVAMLIPASISIPIAGFWNVLRPEGISYWWLNWWLGDTVGVLLAGPVLLSARQTGTSAALGGQAEFALWGVAAAAASIGVLFSEESTNDWLPLLFLPLLLVLWTALRFGVTVTSLCTLAIALIAALSAASGQGPFAQAGLVAGQSALLAYFSVLVLIGLTVSALRGERARAENAVRASEDRYRRLFEAIPQPLWVYDRATLDFLAVNDAAVRNYGYTRAEFLAMSIRDIRPPEDVPLLLLSLLGELPTTSEPRSWRHRLKDGRLIEAEISGHPLVYDGRAAELVLALDVTQTKALQRALLTATAREQRRLGHELHDGLGQEITGLALLAHGLASAAAGEGLSIAGEISKLAQLASRAIQTCRTIASGLSPLGEAEGALVRSLRELADRQSHEGGPEVHFELAEHAPLRLGHEAANHLYRIAQEALTNALKHAGAAAVTIALDIGDSRVRLEVRDNGAGLSGNGAAAGLGLKTMRYRAGVIGAELLVQAQDPSGVAVVCVCPQPR